ncbi:MAG: recombinase family protein [Syntrophobacteraceae bacterium]
MKAYSYIRFSTPDQIKGDSKRRQFEGAVKWAEEHALELDDKLTYEDLGVSGFRGQNAATGALSVFLEALRRGDVEKGSYLLVENLDRLTRDCIVDAQSLFLQIITSGITLVTLMDDKEYSRESLNANPIDMVGSILNMWRANQESVVKSNRIKSAWTKKRAQMPEQAVLARLPAWLEFDKATNTFKVVEERAEVVRRVFNMASTGCGIHSIVKALNHDRIPNFGHGKMWYSSYISLLLSSPTVVGDFIPHIMDYEDGKKTKKPTTPILNYYPAIIDRDLYQQVRALTQSKAPLRGRSAGSPIRNIFGGLAKCPICGSTMSLIDKGKRGYTYMACSKARVGAGCRYKATRYEMLEQFFVKEAHYLKIPIGVEHLDQGWDGLTMQIDVTQDARIDILEKLANGKPNPVLTRMVKDLDAEIADLERQRDAMMPEIALRRERLTDLNIERMQETCKGTPLDKAKLNAVMRQLLKGITIDYRSGELILEWKHGGESSLKFAWGEEDESGTRLTAN